MGNFLYDTLQERRNRLRLHLEVRQEYERLGFSVRSKHGNLTGARVRCNRVQYEWESGDGVKTREKDIFAGDDPSVFYPFKHSATWIDSKDLADLTETPYTSLVPKGGQVRGAVLLKLIDDTTEKTSWTHMFILGKDAVEIMLAAGNALPGEFPIYIQIIAQEIEEEKYYTVGLGAPLTVIDLDREKPIIRYNFSLRQRTSWFSPKIKGPLYPC